MATYLADKVIVFDGTPAKDAYCTSPEGLVSGMNKFLKLMDITFRRDPTNFRPRINKLASQKDQEQKLAGNYFLMEGQMEEEKKEEEKDGKKKPKTVKEVPKNDDEEVPIKESHAPKKHQKGGDDAPPSKGEKKSKKDKE